MTSRTSSSMKRSCFGRRCAREAQCPVAPWAHFDAEKMRPGSRSMVWVDTPFLQRRSYHPKASKRNAAMYISVRHACWQKLVHGSSDTSAVAATAGKTAWPGFVHKRIACVYIALHCVGVVLRVGIEAHGRV